MKALTDIEARLVFPEVFAIKKREKYWSVGCTDEEFQELYFNSLATSVLFLESKDCKIKHFVYINLDTTTEAFAWLLYSDKSCWNTTETKDFVEKIKKVLKTHGVKEILFSTYNTKRSYQRWVSKLGAVTHEITYKVTL